MLFKNSTIKSYLAALILVLFAYSITPKIVLHNLVANHIDKSKVLNSHLNELSASGYNCKCDNLVAESPFIPAETFTQQVFTSYFSFISLDKIPISSFAQLFAELRGPPVN